MQMTCNRLLVVNRVHRDDVRVLEPGEPLGSRVGRSVTFTATCRPRVSPAPRRNNARERAAAEFAHELDPRSVAPTFGCGGGRNAVVVLALTPNTRSQIDSGGAW